MSTLRSLGRALALALGLFVIQALWAAAVPPAFENTAGGSVVPYVLASNLLIALVLVRIGERSPARGGPLVASLAAVTAGIPVLYLLETVFFDIGIPRDELRRLFGQAALTGTAAAVLAVLVVRKLTGASPPLPALPLRPGGLAASAAVYVACYFAAGLLAWPFLRPYYEGRAMPPVSGILVLQVVRGLALSLIVWWLARHEPGGRRPAMLTAGLAMSIVGGIAPLIIPGNPYLPDAARHAHLVEVGISNFVFGVLAARLLAGQGR
jgi:hypothetical protein